METNKLLAMARAGREGKMREQEIFEALKAQRGPRWAHVVEITASATTCAHLLASGRMPEKQVKRLLEEVNTQVLVLATFALTQPGEEPSDFGPKDEAVCADIHTLFGAKVETIERTLAAGELL